MKNLCRFIKRIYFANKYFTVHDYLLNLARLATNQQP